MRQALHVTLFRDFREDARASMDYYADCVRDALLRIPGTPIAVSEVTPRVPLRARTAGTLPSPWRMRFARYVSYPLQARAARGAGVNHIVDHGYAHLLHTLDPARTVVTVHDLIPLLAWRGVIANHGVAHRPLLAEYAFRAARKAAHIVAVSENTRNDLVTHLGFSPQRISVVHNGLAPHFRPLSADERAAARAAFGLGADSRVVLITGWQHYKNHQACAEAFAGLVREARGEPLTLVRLGRVTPEWRALTQRHGIEGRVVEIGWVEEEHLPGLYNACDVLLFPSIYEGFGWPPLQAMACGVPVVCSTGGALHEIAGDAAITVGSADVPAMVAGLKRLLFDADARAEYVRRGLSHSARFSWDGNAAALAELYSRLAGVAPRPRSSASDERVRAS